MKIIDIKVHHYEWERGPYHWRDGIMPSGSTARGALLRILTDEGIEGLSPYRSGASLAEVKYQLIGENPLDRERIWHKFWRNLRTSRLGLAICGPERTIHSRPAADGRMHRCQGSIRSAGRRCGT